MAVINQLNDTFSTDETFGRRLTGLIYVVVWYNSAGLICATWIVLTPRGLTTSWILKPLTVFVLYLIESAVNDAIVLQVKIYSALQKNYVDLNICY